MAISESSILPLSLAETLRILVVEDDPVMQLGLEQFLSEIAQFSVIALASDGYSGVEMTRHFQPDIVIMDVGLPRLDSIAATQQIKSELPQVRVAILTCHNAETEAIAALAAGADAYCIKGTSLQSLLAAIVAARDGAIYLDPQIARCVVKHFRVPNKQSNSVKLSQRELEVLKLLVEGKSNPEIAAILYLSPSTIKAHIRGIMNKLAVDDRVQAAVAALRLGLIS